jgi:hypothetical protein
MASDNFNRANADPVDGSWATSSAWANLELVSNAVQAVTANNDSVAVSTASTAADSQVTLSNVAAGGLAGPAIHLSTSAGDGYTLLHNVGFLHIYELPGFGDLGSFFLAPPIADGDVLRLRRVGTTLVASYNGTDVITTAAETTYTGGAPGMFIYDATVIDDWTDSAAGGTTITPTVGALALAGLAPTVTTSGNRTITPAAGALTFAGLVPSLTYTLPPPPSGSLALAGLAPNVIRGTIITPAAGELSASGLAPTVRRADTITPPAGALVLAGLAPSVTSNGSITLTPNPGALALAGLAPTVTQTTNAAMQPAAGALSLQGFAPTVTVGNARTIAPDPGALSLAGLAPTVTRTDNHAITPQSGALVLGASAPVLTLSDNRLITPSAGSLTLAGLTPVIPVPSPEITPDSGALALQGYAPTVTVSGDTVLDAKYLGRPNVVVKALRDLGPTPAPTLAPDITNMPGALQTRGRGVDLGLLPAGTVARAEPTTAPPAPTARPPRREATSAPATAPTAAPTSAPTAPPGPPPPAATVPPKSEIAQTQELISTLIEHIRVTSTVDTDRVVAAIETVGASIDALARELEADRKARDLREKNLLRAKQLAERLLGET